MAIAGRAAVGEEIEFVRAPVKRSHRQVVGHLEFAAQPGGDADRLRNVQSGNGIGGGEVQTAC